MLTFKVTADFNVEASHIGEARERVRDLLWNHYGINEFNDLLKQARVNVRQLETTPSERALAAILKARDFHAENGYYPPGTITEGQWFEDWAADLAESTLRGSGLK